MSSVKVAVRARPFNNRELSRDCVACVQMSDKTTSKLHLLLPLSRFSVSVKRESRLKMPPIYRKQHVDELGVANFFVWQIDDI